MTTRIDDRRYFVHCERLWKDWLGESQHLLKSIRTPFNADFAPEPYLRFNRHRSPTTRPLRILLTNPGKGREEQTRSALKLGAHGVRDRMTYDQASLAFGNFYRRELGGTAKRRIDAMLSLAEGVGADSVLQFETIPFHSESLPGKRKLPELIESIPALSEYSAALRSTLATHQVIALSAAPSNATLSAKTISESDWLSWQARLIGIDEIDGMQSIPLVRKNQKPTCVFVRSKEHHGSGFVLMMGGNHFPGNDALKKLAEFIKRDD